MRSVQMAMLALVLGAPVAAFAANGPMGSIGPYGVRTDLEENGVKSSDGAGAGIRGWVSFGVPFVHGEYQQARIETLTVDRDVENLRVGGGASFRISDRIHGVGKAEYVDIAVDFTEDQDGAGAHAGVILMFHERLHFFGTVGHLWLDRTDGFEVNAGASFHVNKQFGIFADARRYRGSIDGAPAGADDYEMTDVRAGGMLLWGR